MSALSLSLAVAALPPARKAVPVDDFFPLLVPLVAFVLAVFSPAVLNDPDTFWHLAAGQWIFAHGVPTADPFSFSMPGAPWSAHEWLTEILFAGAFRLAGWSGVVLLTGAAVGPPC